MHWIHSQHSPSFCLKYLIPTLFPFFFLSVFHSIFFPPPFLLPFFPFVLLTSPFFLSFFLFSSFFFLSFFFFPIFPPSFFPLLFYLPPFYLVYPTNHLKCPATFEHLHILTLVFPFHVIYGHHVRCPLVVIAERWMENEQ